MDLEQEEVIPISSSQVGVRQDTVVMPKQSVLFGLKRLFDLIVAVPLLVLLSPLMLVIAVVVRLETSGNPFFMQERVGYLGKRFTLLKFRTMYKDRSVVIVGKEVREDDDRVTRVGRILRRSKVDELPQLINIALGHMTIVGPRPDIPAQVQSYTPFQKQRLLVPPGLTGVAQVSGNTLLPWWKRIVLDVWYIQNWSLWLDIRIIFFTFHVLFSGERLESDPFGLRTKLFDAILAEEK